MVVFGGGGGGGVGDGGGDSSTDKENCSGCRSELLSAKRCQASSSHTSPL